MDMNIDINMDVQDNPDKTQQVRIQNCIQSLVHGSRCEDQQCSERSCTKMKRVMAHTKICRRETEGGCPICKQVVALCCYHAKYCNEVKCLVPFCPSIKHKMKQDRLSQSFGVGKCIKQKAVSIMDQEKQK